MRKFKKWKSGFYELQTKTGSDECISCGGNYPFYGCQACKCYVCVNCRPNEVKGGRDWCVSCVNEMETGAL